MSRGSSRGFVTLSNNDNVANDLATTTTTTSNNDGRAGPAGVGQVYNVRPPFIRYFICTDYPLVTNTEEFAPPHLLTSPSHETRDGGIYNDQYHVTTTPLLAFRETERSATSPPPLLV